MAWGSMRLVRRFWLPLLLLVTGAAVWAGSLSHHPAGITHGPHPGAYESPSPARFTDEVAVMLDCTAPLDATAAALAIEDDAYHASFEA